MEKPAMGTGRLILAVAGAVDPESFPGVTLNLEVITHRDELGITLPPFAEHAFWTVSAFDAAANAAR
jgi:hypothetical protein